MVNYFRLSADGRLLFGGGESYGYRFPRDIAALVRPRMLAVYPELADVPIDYAWGGTLAITVDRMPAFQRLAPTVVLGGRLFGARRGAGDAGRQADGRGGAGHGRSGSTSSPRLPQPRFPAAARCAGRCWCWR